MSDDKDELIRVPRKTFWDLVDRVGKLEVSVLAVPANTHVGIIAGLDEKLPEGLADREVEALMRDSLNAWNNQGDEPAEVIERNWAFRCLRLISTIRELHRRDRFELVLEHYQQLEEKYEEEERQASQAGDYDAATTAARLWRSTKNMREALEDIVAAKR